MADSMGWEFENMKRAIQTNTELKEYFHAVRKDVIMNLNK